MREAGVEPLPIDLNQNLCRPILPLDEEEKIPSFKHWGKTEI